MKLKGRILALALVLALAFGLTLSTLLLLRGFEDNREAERTRGREESAMFAATLTSGLEAFSSISPGDYVVRAARTAERYMTGSALFSLVDASGTVAYTNADTPQLLLLEEAPSASLGDRLIKQGDRVYQVLLVALDHEGMQLKYLRDISRVYQGIEAQTRDAVLLLLALYVLLALLLFWALRAVFRPLTQLGEASLRIAGGDYATRAQVRHPEDEVGLLAQRFNTMAEATQVHVTQLTEQAQAQKQFVADMAHEMKTPLTSMIGYADLLRRHDAPEAQRQTALEAIVIQGERLERMAFKLLQLARLEGGQALDMQTAPLARLFDQAEEALKGMLDAKDLTLVKQVREERCLCEPDLMLSLLQNLLANAIHASSLGGKILLTAKDHGFSVQDHGSGIPAEHLPHITQAFYMADSSRSRSQEGAGLGLALCARIAALHKAHLQIDSQEGQGTTVTVEFTSS
ncbi:MAG: HAMP domain-containing histidine kinase [Clostridiales bacterium]|nr:HAMP domain-containing histidine kinase [Clostridiales bacterium]